MIAEIVGAASMRGQPVQAQLPRLINVRGQPVMHELQGSQRDANCRSETVSADSRAAAR